MVSAVGMALFISMVMWPCIPLLQEFFKPKFLIFFFFFFFNFLVMNVLFLVLNATHFFVFVLSFALQP